MTQVSRTNSLCCVDNKFFIHCSTDLLYCTRNWLMSMGYNKSAVKVRKSCSSQHFLQKNEHSNSTLLYTMKPQVDWFLVRFLEEIEGTKKTF